MPPVLHVEPHACRLLEAAPCGQVLVAGLAECSPQVGRVTLDAERAKGRGATRQVLAHLVRLPAHVVPADQVGRGDRVCEAVRRRGIQEIARGIPGDQLAVGHASRLAGELADDALDALGCPGVVADQREPAGRVLPRERPRPAAPGVGYRPSARGAPDGEGGLGVEAGISRHSRARRIASRRCSGAAS